MDAFRRRVGERAFRSGRIYHEKRAVVEMKMSGNTLNALCKGSGSAPYSIWVRLAGDSGDFSIEEAFCSCPVGKGGHCKHVAAVLIAWSARKLAQNKRTSQEMLVPLGGARPCLPSTSPGATAAAESAAPSPPQRRKRGTLLGGAPSSPKYDDEDAPGVSGGMMGNHMLEALGIQRWDRRGIEIGPPQQTKEGVVASMEAIIQRLRDELSAKDTELRLERERNERLLLAIDRKDVHSGGGGGSKKHTSAPSMVPMTSSTASKSRQEEESSLLKRVRANLGSPSTRRNRKNLPSRFALADQLRRGPTTRRKKTDHHQQHDGGDGDGAHEHGGTFSSAPLPRPPMHKDSADALLHSMDDANERVSSGPTEEEPGHRRGEAAPTSEAVESMLVFSTPELAQAMVESSDALDDSPLPLSSSDGHLLSPLEALGGTPPSSRQDDGGKQQREAHQSRPHREGRNDVPLRPPPRKLSYTDKDDEEGGESVKKGEKRENESSPSDDEDDDDEDVLRVLKRRRMCSNK